MTTQPKRFPIWATGLTLLGLSILCTLGTWQIQRLSWKTDMLAKLDAAYSQETSLALDLSDAGQDYAYGNITGIFMPDKAFLLGPPSMQDEMPGYHLIVPLAVQERTLLIDMGWSAEPLEEQPIHDLQNAEITFIGLIKRSRWNAFTPENIPDQDIWYRLDIAQIEKEKALKNLYPAKLLAEKSSHDFGATFFNGESPNRPTPNNNHLQYALFWYAMAAALMAVYVFRFLIKQKK